jgi:hypothetical protein
MADLFEACQKAAPDIVMSRGELGGDLIEDPTDFNLPQGRNPRRDGGDALWAAWIKRPQENP